jgi:hypothetical protein
VRRKFVLAPVPRQERHANPAHVPDRDRRRRRSVRRLDVDLVNGLDERVEPRPAEDADGCGAQLDPLEVPAGCFDDPPDDPEDPLESDPEPEPEPFESDPDPLEPEPVPSEPEPEPELDPLDDFFDSDEPDPPSPFDFDDDRLSVL